MVWYSKLGFFANIMRKPTSRKKIIAAAVMTFVLPIVVLAQSPSSTNYRLDDSELNFGGEYGTSTNYGTRGSIGEAETGQSTSTHYNIFSGFFPPAYPGVPGIPTLTNTGGILYSGLDFIVSTGGNTSDVNYAIAISTDNFVTTKYVQADDTVGAAAVWQTYVQWGGASGQRLIGLSSNTTYTIKVKARYGQNSETGFSGTASATTVSPSLTVTVAGVASGASIGTFTTNVATTATTVAFSNLQSGSIKIAGQTVTVTTNATAGYTVTLQQDHNLSKTNGATIPSVSSTNASPAAWPASVTTAAFGYHTTDATLCTGTANRFATDNTFAAASTTPYEVSCNTGPASGESTSLVYKVEIEALQAAGDYQNHLTYVVTPQY